MSNLNKHQLEGLREQILKEIKKRYPKKKSDYGIPPEERCPTDLELDMILSCVYHPSHKLYFEALAYTGCRPCELVDLKLEDVDFKNKCVYVWIAKKDRKIKLAKYFPEILELKLKLWIKSHYNDIAESGNFVFFNRFRKRAIDVLEASHSFRRACDRALGERYYTIADDKENPKIKNPRKLRNITLKSLRKYFVSKVYDFSKDGLMSSRLLHHEHIDTSSQYYIALSKEKKKEVVDNAFKKKN